MADIHSRFILDDQASNPLAGYITVAKNAASATTAAQRQLKSYESALRSTCPIYTLVFTAAQAAHRSLTLVIPCSQGAQTALYRARTSKAGRMEKSFH